MPPIYTPPGGWCISPGGFSTGVNAALLWASPTFRNYLGGVLAQVVAPLGIPASAVQAALTQTLAANLPYLQNGAYELAEQLTALWQPGAYVMTAEAGAIEALYNVSVALRRVVIPELAAVAQSNLETTATNLQDNLNAVTGDLRATIAATTTETASEALQAAQAAQAAAEAFAAEGLGTEANARLIGDITVTRNSLARVQELEGYVTVGLCDLQGQVQQGLSTLSRELQATQLQTAQEISQTRAQALQDSIDAANQAEGNVFAVLAPELQAVQAAIPPIVKTLEDCATPYCTEKNQLGKEARDIAGLLTAGGLFAFLAYIIAEPTSAGTAVGDAVNALASTVEGLAESLVKV